MISDECGIMGGSAASIDDEIVIEAAALDAVEDVGQPSGRPQIERCLVDALNLASWDEASINGRVEISVELHNVIVKRVAARRMAGQIEISVVAQIHRRRTAAHCLEIDHQFVLGAQRVSDMCHALTRVTLVHVRAVVGKRDASVCTAVPIPDDPTETVHSSVKMIDAVVDGQSILHAVQREFALSNAIGHTTDQRSEIRIAPSRAQISVHVVESENDIIESSVLIWNA